MRALHITALTVLTAASLAFAQPPRKQLLIGVEYAYPGGGATFGKLGIPAAKHYPDAIPWGEMQKSKDAPINFARMDQFVREYHDAGFTTLVLVLRSHADWASKANRFVNIAPKPEFMPLYAAWVKAMVERYDKDGKDDMPGLKHPVRYFEIGSEFSTFEPEPVSDYLPMLEAAYKAAHAASDKVNVLHAAFLTTTAFRNHPKPGQYEAAFAAMPPRIKNKGLADMRKVLDRKDHFDIANIHALGDPYEIEDMVAWLKWEMKERRYDKPIMISDTSPSPYIAWGFATNAKLPPNVAGVVVPPATDADRPALAEYFKKLCDEDAPTVAWTHVFTAADMVKKIVIAAEQNIVLINAAFMEDLQLFKKLAQAGAGASAWSGFADTKINILNQQRTIVSLRTGFYAIQQVQRNLKNYDRVTRVAVADKSVRLYQVHKQPPVWIAWHETGKVFLPGQPLPSVKFALPINAAEAHIEKMIDRQGLTQPESSTISVRNNRAELTLTPWPVYVMGK